MSRASITKAHQKIQELSWDPTFVEPVDKYPTDYTFEKAPKKDPMGAHSPHSVADTQVWDNIPPLPADNWRICNSPPNDGLRPRSLRPRSS